MVAKHSKDAPVPYEVHSIGNAEGSDISCDNEDSCRSESDVEEDLDAQGYYLIYAIFHKIIGVAFLAGFKKSKKK